MDQQKLNALLAQVVEQARQAGIPVSGEICPEVRINRRAKNRFGGCCRREGRFVIELSQRLLEAEEEAVRRVLAHEVLHTCKGCANHGAKWSAWAGVMNRRYGYGIARTDTFEHLGLEDDRVMKYAVVCEACGSRHLRMKRSPLVDHPERYRCKCGGRLRVERC